MECPCARDNRHACEVHGVLDRRHDQIAHDDLPDLRLFGGAAGKGPLEKSNKDVSERRGNEGAVDSHLGDTWRQVGAIPGFVAGDHGSEDFLERREGSGGEHLGSPVW